MGSGLPSIIQNRPGPWGAVTRRSRASSRATTDGERRRRDIVGGLGRGRRRRWAGQFSWPQAQEVGRSQITNQEKTRMLSWSLKSKRVLV